MIPVEGRFPCVHEVELSHLTHQERLGLARRCWHNASAGLPLKVLERCITCTRTATKKYDVRYAILGEQCRCCWLVRRCRTANRDESLHGSAALPELSFRYVTGSKPRANACGPSSSRKNSSGVLYVIPTLLAKSL